MARKVKYLSNKNMMTQIYISKEQGYMSEELGNMLLLLAKRYSQKPNFCNYSYIDDMISWALVLCCRYWDNFNPEKSQNPFAFFTQIIKNAFIQYLNKESKARELRDALIVDSGMLPSYAYQEQLGQDSINSFDLGEIKEETKE